MRSEDGMVRPPENFSCVPGVPCSLPHFLCLSLTLSIISTTLPYEPAVSSARGGLFNFVAFYTPASRLVPGDSVSLGNNSDCLKTWTGTLPMEVRNYRFLACNSHQ